MEKDESKRRRHYLLRIVIEVALIFLVIFGSVSPDLFRWLKWARSDEAMTAQSFPFSAISVITALVLASVIGVGAFYLLAPTTLMQAYAVGFAAPSLLQQLVVAGVTEVQRNNNLKPLPGNPASAPQGTLTPPPTGNLNPQTTNLMDTRMGAVPVGHTKLKTRYWWLK